MSAQPERASSRAPCACTNISLMQLFHELKQKFPEVPDHVVSSTIALYCHDKLACETHLHSEVKASLTHAYHASSSAAARQINELKLSTPQKCPNQAITKHEVQTLNAIHSITCDDPQVATLSKSEVLEGDKKICTDANQNVVELSDEGIVEDTSQTDVPSPVAVINIDNCLAKYNTQSPSDPDLPTDPVAESDSNVHEPKEAETSHSEPESINYRILKSNKIKNNLNERLEKSKAKRVIQKEVTKSDESEPHEPESQAEKPKRPNTLEFLKPTPDIAFKAKAEEAKPDCQSVSPAQKPETQTTPGGGYWPGGYPLNLSVNVNCHMDYVRGYDPWLEDYSSPRAVTSVNLTVCTPTSSMASPVRDEEAGFEGHVTVTVSPGAAPAPWRRAPPPPQPPADQRILEATNEPTLIARQKERLGKLAAALAQERGRVARLTRETQVLAARPPSPAAARRLRDYVARLRDQCNTLAKRLEVVGNEGEPSDFYSAIYTGQRSARPAPPPPPGPPGPWRCHVCTFRNHPLLDKCEECEMPRILVGTAAGGWGAGGAAGGGRGAVGPAVS